MTPNIEEARKSFSSIPSYGLKFRKYSAAYTTTNENLRKAFQTMQKNAKNVLTIAGSGDHPMFAKLYGAKNIDTFDITYNAKCIMDIKTIAVSFLTFDEYRTLICNLYNTVDILTVPNMQKILKHIPKEESNYLIGMQNFKLFNHGKEEYSNQAFSSQEFEQAQQHAAERFNFIWSDITSLHHHLNKKYDFVHLSNIFDHLTYDERVYVLSNIMRYINANGTLCIQSQSILPKILFEDSIKHEKEYDKRWDVKKTTYNLYNITRTR